MSNTIKVGQVYKLVDASKAPHLEEVLNNGYLTLPDDGIVKISSTNIHPYTGVLVGYSLTKGVKSPDPSWDEKGIIVISQRDLDYGAFELVVEH